MDFFLLVKDRVVQPPFFFFYTKKKKLALVGVEYDKCQWLHSSLMNVQFIQLQTKRKVKHIAISDWSQQHKSEITPLRLPQARTVTLMR